MELAALLKPAPFVVQETGDPEQLLQDFKDYMKTFKKFLIATKVVGEHTASCKDCGACVQARATLELVGGKDITTLFEHVGGVLERIIWSDGLDQYRLTPKELAQAKAMSGNDSVDA